MKDASEHSFPAQAIDPLPHKVSSSTWYQVMAKFGLACGPRFRGLQDISAAVSEHRAVATMTESRTEGEAPYQLHPSTVDSAFQLLSCAILKGVGSSFDRLSVSTYIEELYINPAKEIITIEAEAIPSNTGGMAGNIVGISAGEIAISQMGLRMSPLGDNGEVTNDDPHTAVVQQWKSDVNLFDVKKLVYDGHLLNNIMARPARKEEPRRLTLLCKERSEPHMDMIVQSFIDNSYEIDFCSLDQNSQGRARYSVHSRYQGALLILCN